MRFSPAFLDQIRDRIPIADVVGRGLTWDKRKSQPQRGDYWACCPFHGEKTPSFHADNRRGRYHCFGCGISGDHFTFLVEQEGLSFPEAVEQLAELAGLPMPARDREAEAREAKRASLYDVMEAAAAFFELALAAPEGAGARNYLRSRDLHTDAISRFRIGYAPSSRSALKQHLAKAGVNPGQMVEAGLVVAGDDIPVSYDRFRDRIMFPISDLRGRVIAFGGRALDAGVPAKYLNSPETPLFHKSHVLFNARAAREAGRNGAPVVAVEGYTDAITCVMAGFEATVAPLGTALTDDQLRLLWQMADEPVLCFDGDDAGLKAAYRAIDLALPSLKPGKSLKFAILPEGSDPDDLIRSDGADTFASALESSRPMIDLVWRRETEDARVETPERRAGLEQRLRSCVARIGDVDVRRHYEAAVRERLRALFSTSMPKSYRSRSTSVGGKVPASLTVPSESLRAHRLVRRSGARPTRAVGLSDAILLLALIRHPPMALERIEKLAELSFESRDLEALAADLVRQLADDGADFAEPVRQAMIQAGHGKCIEKLEAKVASAGLSRTLEDNGRDEAAAMWDDAYHLRLRASSLFNERRAVAAALGKDASDVEVTRLRDIQQQELRRLSPESHNASSSAIRHPFKPDRN